MCDGADSAEAVRFGKDQGLARPNRHHTANQGGGESCLVDEQHGV
jgi:hypothetical protein